MQKEGTTHARDVVLQAGDIRCVLRPELGGCVAGMWLGDAPVLRSLPAVRSARDAGMFALVPFSNRIADARLQWGGTTHALARNFLPEPHAIHGIGWQREWVLVQAGPQAASLRLQHLADAHWPFDFVCEQVFRVDRDSLRVSLAMTNTGVSACPAGLGWHPYLVKRPGARIAFTASGRWETDPQSLPLRRVESPGLELSCASLAVNHAFDGWSGVALLHDPVLEVRIRSSVSRLVVSTAPAKDFIAVEPVSHIPDSFGRADEAARGVVVLGPGETFGVDMTIEVRHSG